MVAPVPGFTHDSDGTPAPEWATALAARQIGLLDLEGVERLVVVAAHPDDESLGAGGLIARAAGAGLPVTLVLATAGEHSHPGSPTHTPAQLRDRRLREARHALGVLAPDAELRWVELADGAVSEGDDELTAAIVDSIGERGAVTLVVAPWRHDGHPDHEAAGRAAAAAARRTDAHLAEYPVWWWHWSAPGPDVPWASLHRVTLAPQDRERKTAALAAHASQVAPLSDAPGDEVLLTPGMLAHFEGAEEVFVLEDGHDDRLDRLHRGDPDPWGVDRRWYEERKRELLTAMLPRRRSASALEVGCSTGALTAALLGRAEEVTALDASATAVEAARRRLSGPIAEGRVRVEVAAVPLAWPEGRFDLAVLSEVGYFLSPRELRGTVDRLRESVVPGGVLVLCHWRHHVQGWPLDGPGVHALVTDWWPEPVQARYADRDVEIVVLAAAESWPEPDQ